jgi:glycine hydroxymethyltransferase
VYAEQIIKNAKHLALKLMDKGYDIVSGGTDNHLMLIDLRNKGVTGKAAEDALNAAGITVNKNMVPFDDQSPMITSGIRLGTPAITTRGMKEPEMEIIAELIDRVITNIGNEAVYADVRKNVEELCQRFPLYPELQ